MRRAKAAIPPPLLLAQPADFPNAKKVCHKSCHKPKGHHALPTPRPHSPPPQTPRNYALRSSSLESVRVGEPHLYHQSDSPANEKL